jgi:hypothetical protein
MHMGFGPSLPGELPCRLQEEDPEILTPRFQADLALAYWKTGALEQAEAIINQLIQSSDTTAVGSPGFFHRLVLQCYRED